MTHFCPYSKFWNRIFDQRNSILYSFSQFLFKKMTKIREWKLSDSTEIVNMLSNHDILDNLRDGIPYPYTQTDAENFINEMISADKTKTFAFAIEYEGKCVGSIGVFRQSNIHSRTGELGYYVSKDYWGKGICTSAVKLICNHIFSNTDIIRIFAEPFDYNAASCRVLEKAGFQFEGTLRSNAVKNGKIIDMKMYSIIKQ